MNLLKKILRIDEQGRMLMGDADKVKTDEILKDGEVRVCPPHKMPHVFPWKESVTDEPCHVHTNLIKYYLHHKPFCKILKCPNYKTMCRAKRAYELKWLS